MASNVRSNNKRVFKNTIILYFRMFLIMGVTLYTSRVILSALGVEDFGIYNVVGGVVSILGLVKGVMAGASSRFLNIALGKEDAELAKKTFNISLCIYYALAAVFLVLAETIGLWFLNNELVIAESRMFAANCVYQFTIVSAINHLIASPYNAAIIAHEKMNIFAYIGILEVVLKLLIVFGLFVSPFDHLIVYGLLLMLCDLLITMIYRVYCKRHYAECKFRIYKDKAMYKEILSYSGWNLFGSIAALVKGQGLNILLNMFFNPAVNASRALSYQVNNAVNQFVHNFYTAVRPQITKYYAKNEFDNMFDLVCRSAKLSCFLFIFLTLPIMIETPFIIKLWLGQLPENVIEFIRWILLISALESIQQPLKTTAQATGQVKVYELTIGIITILNIPISYSLLKWTLCPPLIVFQVSLCLASLCFISRLILLKKMVGFPIARYVNYVIVRGLIVVLVAALVPGYLHFVLNCDGNYFYSILTIVLSLICTVLSVGIIGLSKNEKKYLFETLKKKVAKK